MMRSIWMLGLFSFVLVGCGIGPNVSSPALGTDATVIQGRAFGGQQPVANATVTVYEAGSSGYGTGATAKASVTTDAGGNFSFPANSYTCTASNSPMYVVATQGNPGSGTNANLALAAVLGPCSAAKTAFVIINEVTTAGTVLTLGQFMGKTLGASGTAFNIGGTCSGCATGTYNRGLVRAMTYTYPQLIDNAHGAAIGKHVSGVVTVTPEVAKINTIANIIAACVNTTGQTSTTETTTTCGQLFSDVNATNASTRPSDTLQAALQMQLYPYYNVPAVFALGTATPPFGGALTSTPNDWTVAVSYYTPSLGLGISQNTSSNLDIDANGSIWLPTNATGTAGLVYFDPTATTFNGPFGLFSGIYPQYIAIDTTTTPTVWFSDLASSYITSVGVTSNSIGSYNSTAYTYSGPITVDASNNVLFAGNKTSGSLLYAIPPTRSSGIAQAKGSFGDTFTPPAPPNGLASALTVPYTNEYLFVSDTTTSCRLDFSPGSQAAYGPATTGSSTCVTGGLIGTLFGYYNGYSTADAAGTGSICYDNFENSFGCATYSSLVNPRGIAADGAARVWVANLGNDSIAPFYNPSGLNSGQYSGNTLTAVGTTAYIHNATYGGTLTAPYGIGIDGSGNVWVSNAGCVSTSSTRCNASSGYTLSEILGVAAPTITPIAAQGNSFGSRPTN